MQKKTKTLLISSAILGVSALCIAPLVSCTSTIDNETFTANQNGFSIKNDLVFNVYDMNGNKIATQTLNATKPITVSITGAVYSLNFNVKVKCIYVLNNEASISEPLYAINDLPNIYLHQHLLPIIINNQTYIVYLTK